MREPTPTDIVSEDSYNPTPSESPIPMTRTDDDSNMSADVAEVRGPREPFKPVDEDAQPPTAVQDVQGDGNGLTMSQSLNVAGVTTNGSAGNEASVSGQSSGEFSVTQNGDSMDQLSEKGDSKAQGEVSEQPDTTTDSTVQPLVPPGATDTQKMEQDEGEQE